MLQLRKATTLREKCIGFKTVRGFVLAGKLAPCVLGKVGLLGDGGDETITDDQLRRLVEASQQRRMAEDKLNAERAAKAAKKAEADAKREDERKAKAAKKADADAARKAVRAAKAAEKAEAEKRAREASRADAAGHTRAARISRFGRRQEKKLARQAAANRDAAAATLDAAAAHAAAAKAGCAAAAALAEAARVEARREAEAKHATVWKSTSTSGVRRRGSATPSSIDGPAPPRHRAGVASIGGQLKFDFHTGSRPRRSARPRPSAPSKQPGRRTRLCGNQPVSRVHPTILHYVISRRWRGSARSVERRGSGRATPSSWRRVDAWRLTAENERKARAKAERAAAVAEKKRVAEAARVAAEAARVAAEAARVAAERAAAVKGEGTREATIGKDQEPTFQALVADTKLGCSLGLYLGASSQANARAACVALCRRASAWPSPSKGKAPPPSVSDVAPPTTPTSRASDAVPPKRMPPSLTDEVDALPTAHASNDDADDVPALEDAQSSDDEDDVDSPCDSAARGSLWSAATTRALDVVETVYSYAGRLAPSMPAFLELQLPGSAGAGEKRAQAADAAAPPKKKDCTRLPPAAVRERVAAGRNRLVEKNGGRDVRLPQRNSTPKRRLGKKDVTPEYLNVACGLVCAFMCSFFTLDQCHCSWWWHKVFGKRPKITDEADHILPYGWFVRGINTTRPDGGGGRKGNLLSLFKVFKWFDQSGRLDPGAMPQFGLEALGAALGVDWHLAALMVDLDDNDIAHHGLDGWTVDVEKVSASGDKVFYIEPDFSHRFMGKPAVRKYFKALRDAPLPGGMAPLHPKIVELRGFVKGKNEDPDRVNDWKWNSDKNKWVDPTDRTHSGPSSAVKALKALPARATLDEDSERASTRRRQKPKDIMTDQPRHPSCLETMGTICDICGAECGTHAELKRHRETDHPDAEPVQAREFPCRVCFINRFGRSGRKLDRRGKVCPQCEFMTRGSDKYWVLQDLIDKEAYLEYLDEPGYDQYLEEHGYDDAEEPP